MMEHITFISAGAGSGKTYRLAADLEKILTAKVPANPAGVIGTTFTKLAAGELRERVRQRLNERGYTQIANQMDQAMLGTVNSVCGQLLNRFAFEAGLSPQLKVIEETEANHLFSLALEQVLDIGTVQTMNSLAYRLGQDEWKSVIKDIVSTARSNNQSSEEIENSGKTSADSLLKFFPDSSKKDLDKELYNMVESAIEFIQNGEDTTKGTQRYLDLLQSLVTPIKYQNLAWSNWVKLSKLAATKKSQDASDAVQAVATDFEKHPRLQLDIREYCEYIFSIAAKALAHFQQFKKVRGLIDFTDQEHLLYKALENSQVQDILKDELDLLMVDEFQDTSPIQLALFLRLAELAKQVIWVGDVKQAIYGFRGSDPELMQAILKYMEANGGKTEVLETSWRSRPELVNYINEIFVPAFANTLDKERVALQPRPGDYASLSESTVEHWQTLGSNKTKRALALAKAVQEFIKENYQLTDKNTAKQRTASYGDIAVLSRTHANLEEMAAALAAFNIPVSRSQTGLLKTPETALVLAAIRYLVDPNDSLATAEIICLTQADTPETWLQSRLDYIADEDRKKRWGDDNALLQKLAEQRERVQYLTPSEVMALAIHSTDIRHVILGWQPDIQRAKQRLLNVEQLLIFAETYENQCVNSGDVATVTGLLLWLAQLANDEEDKQVANTQKDAVQLLTHHGAKGLEWPVVIAMDLDSTIKNNLWGVSVKANNKNLDITQPLKGRSLQYWLWPFGKQANGTSIKEKVEQSEFGLAELVRAWEEAKRLLYVSLTRPRDCLIIPLKNNKGEWLSCLEADWMLPNSEESNELNLPESEQTISAAFKIFSQEERPDLKRTKLTAPHWFEPIKAGTEKLPAKISPSSLPPIETAKVIATIELGDRISLQGTPDMTNLGEAIHALIATQIINNPDNPAVLTEQVLKSYAVTKHIALEDALTCVSRFKQFTEEQFNAKAIHVEYPIEYQLSNGQVASGWIDALVETEQGYIIIDHKSNPQSRVDWHDVALKYSGQLALYKEAVEAAADMPVIGCWIHFAVTGGVLEIGLKGDC